MNTQQTSDKETRPTDLSDGRRLDSILRTMTVAVALLIFGFSAPMAFADHMGNHERGPSESTESTGPGFGQTCGLDVVDLPTTRNDESDSAFSRNGRPW